MLQDQDVGRISVAMLLNVQKSAGLKDLVWEIAKVVGGTNIPLGYDLFPSGGALLQTTED